MSDTMRRDSSTDEREFRAARNASRDARRNARTDALALDLLALAGKYAVTIASKR